MEVTRKEGKYIIKGVKYFLPRCVENSNIEPEKLVLYQLACDVYIEENKVKLEDMGNDLSLTYVNDSTRNLKDLKEDLDFINQLKLRFIWYPCTDRKDLF